MANSQKSEIVQAARVGDLDEVKRLVKKGQSVNDRGNYNVTPLHLASLYGHTHVVEWLCERDADVNARDDWGCTPLHNAAGNGHVDVITELVESGAELEPMSNNRGKKPRDYAFEKDHMAARDKLMSYIKQAKKAQQNGLSSPGLRRKRRDVAADDESGSGSGARGGSGNQNGSITWKDKSSAAVLNNAALPGQVSRENSARMSEEKRNLKRQLEYLEQQEQLRKLSKEFQRTNEQMEVASGRYERELEDKQKRIVELQEETQRTLGQRDSELTQLALKLSSLQDSIIEAQRSHEMVNGSGTAGAGSPPDSANRNARSGRRN